MFDDVYNWILTILTFALDTFETILESTGTTSFYISGFFIFFAMSAFFLPMLHKGISLGGSGSDTVSPRNHSRFYRSYKRSNKGSNSRSNKSNSKSSSKRGK